MLGIPEPNPTMDERYQSDDTPHEKSLQPRTRRKSITTELKGIISLDDVKSEFTFWKKLKRYLQDQPAYANKQQAFTRICGLCLATPNEPKLLLKFRNTGLRRMQMFLERNTRKEVQSKNMKLLMWSCLNLLSFFYTRRQVEECSCFRGQKLQKCQTLYLSALYMVLPEQQEDVMRHTVKYITLTCQWNTEDYDLFVFQEMFLIITKPEVLVAKIIKQIETSQRELALKEAYDTGCTLSNILEHARWDKYLFNHLLHNCLNTLLKMYLICNTPMPAYLRFENVKLRIVIRTCLKYFMNNIKDNKGLVSVMDSLAKCLLDLTIIPEDRREIMEMLVFSAQKHQTKFYRESITPDCLNLLLNSLISDDKVLAMSSHKVIKCILDRHANEKIFTEPIYFFKGRSNFVINYDMSIEDIHFFKSFSQKFFEGILNSFLKFTEKYCLITCYVTLCILLVEIPEPVITINTIHLLITVQNETLKLHDLPLTVKAHTQSIVAALMSLICVIHDDKVVPLKKYVEEVVRFRTENSPHLLPPLQNKYVVAGHHTTEYHEQLYFQEDETLYALQRCWLGRRILSST